MNLPQVYRAIYTRANADTGSGGLFGTPALITGFYSAMAPPALAASYPYVYCVVASTQHTDAFSMDFIEVDFQLHTVGLVTAGMAAMEAICDRLYGDATTHSDRVPTFGFHRHPLVIASGTWTGNVCEHIDQTTDNSLDVYHIIDSFKTRISRSA